MAEIKTIIEKYDVAAFVLLHEPAGFAEFLNKPDPSWSAIKPFKHGIIVRLKSKEVGLEQAKIMADSTYNMVTHFTDMLAMHAHLYQQMKEHLKEKWGGYEEDEGNLTGKEEQNN